MASEIIFWKLEVCGVCWTGAFFLLEQAEKEATAVKRRQ
jgi:hypothetical protein